MQSKNFSTFLVATFGLVPLAPSSIRPTPGSVVSRAMRPTRAFGPFVCSLSMIYAGCLKDKAMSLDLVGFLTQKYIYIREASNFAQIRNISRLTH